MDREALRRHVLEHSVRRGEFTLKSGQRSTWFLDTKQTACRPEGILLVADAALPLLPAEATAIGGLTMGADPVAFGIAAVAATRGRPLRSFSVRKEAKDHGVTGRLAGALEPGDKVVITEDTVTRGSSIMEAVDAVQAFGAEPVAILVIVDRGGTCGELAASARHPVPAPADGRGPRLRVRHLTAMATIRAVTFDYWNTIVRADADQGSYRVRAWRDEYLQIGHDVDEETIRTAFRTVWDEHHSSWLRNEQYLGARAGDAAVDLVARPVDAATRARLVERFLTAGEEAGFTLCDGVGLCSRGAATAGRRPGDHLRRRLHALDGPAAHAGRLRSPGALRGVVVLRRRGVVQARPRDLRARARLPRRAAGRRRPRG